MLLAGICTNQTPSCRMRHKILWNIEIRRDPQRSARRLYQTIINKKKKKRENLPNSELCRPRRPLSENQRKRKGRQLLRPCQRTKSAMEHEGDGDTNCYRYTWNDTQRLTQGAARVGNRRTRRDHLNYSIAKIGLNTEKNPGKLKRFDVTRPPVKTISWCWWEKFERSNLIMISSD